MSIRTDRSASADEPAPPWKVFPGRSPLEILTATQGLEEAWLDHLWRPFWTSLRREEREAYCDRWAADEQWRTATRIFGESNPIFEALEAGHEERPSALATGATRGDANDGSGASVERDVTGSPAPARSIWTVATGPADEPAPPWRTFPGMSPLELSTAVDGLHEAWLHYVWRPYWGSLSSAQRETYLARWRASDEWRAATIGYREPWLSRLRRRLSP